MLAKNYIKKNISQIEDKINIKVKMKEKIAKIDIWGSPSVTHKTTNQTLSRLTSEFGWDPVRST